MERPDQGHISRWFRKHEHKELLSELECGDLIEFERGCYKHWAVYAGNRMVYHRAYPEDGDSIQLFIQSQSASKGSFRYGEITLEDLLIVWEDSEARINNSMDSKYEPSDCKTVLGRAKSKMKESQQKKDMYNVIFNNCEHFATYCRYGIGFSQQVENVKENLKTVGILVVVGVLLGKTLSLITDRTDRRSQ